MAAAGVEYRCATMLRSGGLMSVSIGLYMGQMALGQDVGGVLQNLTKSRQHNQDNRESTDLGQPEIHCHRVYAI